MSQQDQAFIRTFIGVLGILVGIAILLFFIARILTADTGSEASRADDPQIASAVEERIQPFGTVNVGEGQVQQAAATTGAMSGKQVVEATCAACHASGVMGAPVIGKKGDWAPRLEKGADVLLQNAMQGFNAMPPKGGNPALDEQAIKAAIGHMLSESGLEDPYGGAAAQTAAASSGSGASGGADLAQGQQVYQQTCFACHGTGAAGAPKLTDAAAWQPRIAQGKETLYQHAIQGFKAMPPKGGNPGLSDAQVKAAVDFMLSEVQ